MEIATLVAAAAIAGTITISDGDNYNIEQYLKPDTKTVIIMKDLGGDIYRFERNAAILRAREIQVRIAGQCISACMFYMRLPNACAIKGGELWTHTPNLPNYGPTERRRVEAIARRYFTPSVMKVINQNGGIWRLGRDNYLKMKALDHLKAC